MNRAYKFISCLLSTQLNSRLSNDRAVSVSSRRATVGLGKFTGEYIYYAMNQQFEIENYFDGIPISNRYRSLVLRLNRANAIDFWQDANIFCIPPLSPANPVRLNFMDKSVRLGFLKKRRRRNICNRNSFFVHVTTTG